MHLRHRHPVFVFLWQVRRHVSGFSLEIVRAHPGKVADGTTGRC